MLPSDLEIH